MAKIKLSDLYQKWVHSHEEDTDTEMVFRPATYKFPPSRGRNSFELMPDGSAVWGGIGPTDQREYSQRKWKLEDHNLCLYEDPKSTPVKTMKIISVTPDRLTVEK